jgi:hypothetical protein
MNVRPNYWITIKLLLLRLKPRFDVDGQIEFPGKI